MIPKTPAVSRASARVALAFLLFIGLVTGVGTFAPDAATAASGRVYGGMITDTFHGHAQVMEDFAAWAGKRLTFSGTFHDIAENPGATDHKLEQAWIAKTTPFANIEASASAQELASGSLDAKFRAFAESVKKWLAKGGGRSVIVAPLQEMNGSWTQWGCDAPNFKTAYRRFRSAFASVGIDDPTKVRWAFAPNGWTDPACGSSMRDYYPGDDVVDLVGISAYNYGPKEWDGKYRFAAEVYGPWLDQLRTFVPNLPYVIAQTGTAPTGGDRDAWLQDMGAYLAADPNVVAWIYFNVDKAAAGGNEWDWRVFGPDVQAAGMRHTMLASHTGYVWPISEWFKPGKLSLHLESPSDGAVQRLAGEGRIATSIAVSKSVFGSAKTVVLATAGTYPDALAGAPLAAQHQAPLLLVPSDALSDEVASEIRRLGASSAIILGGPGSVGPAVEQAVRDMGLAVERVAGTSRYATAAAVARKLGGTRAYLVEGANAHPSRGWPDAVSVSGLAAAQGRPVLLATTDGVPGDTMDVLKELGVREVTVVGGVNALPDGILDPIREFATVSRIAGDSRYTTSLEVAKVAVKAGLSANGAILTTGGNWPDALAGGPAAAKLRVFSLLVPPDSIDAAASTRDWLASTGPDNLNLIGGPNSISYAIESWANTITK